MNYFWQLATLAAIYLILAQSLNLAVGYAGLLSLTQGAFLGVGAYTAAIAMRHGVPFAVSLGLAAALTASTAAVAVRVLLRMRGDAFVIGTLGLQVIVSAAMYNADCLTGGPFGLSGIPRPTWWGTPLDGALPFAVVALSVAAAVTVMHVRLSSVAFGRTIRAVRDDALVARSLGKDADAFRANAFVLSAAVAGLAGAVYASYVSYIDPTSFTLEQSILILTAVALGGAGNVRGPVVGALLIVGLPELLRFVRIPDSVAPYARQMAYGFLLILLMRVRPQGLAGDYGFDR